jgi:predicted alpha/beta-hydrolase family hydrolase
METRKDHLHISDEMGHVSCEIMLPKNPDAILTLAHGAGAGMQHDFMIRLSHALAERNLATVRFNFPFTERGKKRPDTPAVAQKTIEAVYHYTKEHYPMLPIFLAGKSFGGRMSSQWLSIHPPSLKVSGIIFYGFPLHPAGKPSITRAAHLSEIVQPMLFLQGAKDALAGLALLQDVLKDLPSATLVTFDKVNHGFQIGKRDVIKELAESTASWVHYHLFKS